jgi:cytoskeleton protein RodZ
MKRSKNLTEIAAETRISRRYLEAIEADNVSELPGDFFYKAFIRQYARVLELDERTTHQIVGAAVTIPEPDPVPALNLVYEKAQNGASTRWHPSTGVAVGVLVVVLAGGSGLYALWQRSQSRAEEPVTPVATAPSPASVETTAVQPPAAASPPPTTPAPVTGTSPTTATVPGTESPPTAAPAQPVAVSEGQVTVDVTATETAWVQVSSEGKTVFIGTLEPNQPRSFAVGPNGKLLTGNAGAVEVRMNGKPLGALGPKGQVRTVLFSGGEAQIVAPKPKVPETQVFSTPQAQE